MRLQKRRAIGRSRSAAAAADATITVNRTAPIATSRLKLHALHLVNSIRGSQNGSGQHNASALANAIAACNQVFDGHASHLGMNDGGGWQMLDPTPYGGYTVGSQVAGATLNVELGTQFPASGGSTGYVAKVFPADHIIGDDFTFTGVTGNQLTGCAGLPATIPPGSCVVLFAWTNNGQTAPGPQPAYRPLLFDNNQSYSIKELFDVMTGTTRTLVLHGASKWMHGQASMNSPPRRANFKIWATAAAEIAYQFAQAGTPLTHIGVWNEWKGYANHVGPGNQGGSGTLQNGQTGVLIPSDAGAAAGVDANYPGNNGYEWLAYTMMYNAVWDAFKNHPSASVNTLKIMGPHDNIGSVGLGAAGWDHLYPFGTFDGTLQASGFRNGTHVPQSSLDRDRICYFLDYSTGFDGVTLDFSVQDNGTSGNITTNEAFVLANYQVFRDIIRQIKSVLANRPGLSAAKRAATVNFIEYYADVNLTRVSYSDGNNFGLTDLQQGFFEGCMLRCFLEEQLDYAYRWAPMSDGTNPMWNKGGYFLYTQTQAAGTSRHANAIVGEASPPNVPGATLPAFAAAKILRDNFPAGTDIYPNVCSDASGRIWGISSPTKTVIANGYNVSKTVLAEGSVRTVPAYGFVVVP